jgi:NAD(P)-dependent dehydrogenase (short-subunit alcohol dehydrogenase family)
MTNSRKRDGKLLFNAPMERRHFLALSSTAALSAAMNSNVFAQESNGQTATPAWTADNIPLLAGRTVVITGGNGVPTTIAAGSFPPAGTYSGLGYEDALALAGKGADVIIASRNAEKGAQAVAEIKKQHPEAKIRFEQFDLSDLASVTAFSDRLKSQLPRIDILINNAATAGTPDRRVNAAGQELCWAINVVGHYSLNAQLMPLLRESKSPRVVWLGSGAARRAEMVFDDLQTTREYTPLKAYAISKVAILVLARELNRRSVEGGWNMAFIAVHPGTAKTYLIPSGPGPDSDFGRGLATEPGLFKPAEIGALSTLYAAVDPGAQGGFYYGPINPAGDVGVSEDHAKTSTHEVAARLYDELTKTTSLTFS